MRPVFCWTGMVLMAGMSSLAAQEPRLQHTFTGSDKQVLCIAFSPDGKALASGGQDLKVQLWDLATGKSLGVLPELGFIRSLTFNRDGTALVTCTTGVQGRITLWNMVTKESVASEKPAGDVLFAAFDRDGRTVVWVDHARIPNEDSEDRGIAYATTVKRWNTVSNEHSSILSICKDDGSFNVNIRCEQDGPRMAIKGYTHTISAVAFSPDDRLVAGGDDRGIIELWDLIKAKQIAAHTHPNGFLSFGVSLTFSPDSKILASGGGDKTVRLWDVATGNNTATLSGHDAQVFSVAFSADGRMLASSGWEQTVKLWDAATRKNVGNMNTGSEAVNCVAFSPDGKTVASGGSDGVIKVWDVSELLQIGK